jgi:hypothetical protein
MSTIASDHEHITASHAIISRKPARRTIQLLVASLLLYAAVNIADLVSTYIGLRHGLREGNPLMSHLLATYGFSSLILYKVFVIAVVSCGVLILRNAYPRVARVTVVVCNLLVAGAVLLNIMQFMAIS